MKEKVHELTDADLTEKLASLKAELFNLRFSHATGQLSNPMQIQNVRRDIARVKTVIRERELRANKEVK
ncbi:MAG: 50S ribosomal protein L29 [Clostridiales bacterium]|nr:50S ribosomal protein L29 [Clostridiales bacterium]